MTKLGLTGHAETRKASTTLKFHRFFAWHCSCCLYSDVHVGAGPFDVCTDDLLEGITGTRCFEQVDATAKSGIRASLCSGSSATPRAVHFG